jgi:hypothetical protein
MQDIVDKQLSVQLAFAQITRDPEVLEGCLKLVGKFNNTVLKNDELPDSGDEDLDRYNEVFGDVSEEEVEKLNEFLSRKADMDKQVRTTKEVAMEKLSRELAAKFKQRIRT